MDFAGCIRDKRLVTPPRTSSRELHEFFRSLGLNVELHPEATAELEQTLDQLIAWYSDASRAAEAKVFALGGEAPAPRDVLGTWVGRTLPEELEGYALLSYAADVLFIAGGHGASGSALQLLALESDDATLYLLRSHGQRKQVGNEGWLPSTMNSPDTEAALSGIFRVDGCTPAFAEHAAGCDACLEALEAWDYEHGLPEGFEAFRRAPMRVARKPVDEGPIQEGVAIFIPRPPEKLPKPWWKFWA